MGHTQIDPDRTGNKISIRVSTASTIYGTSIHTRTATNTIQCLDMVGLGQQCTPAIVHNNDVIFTSFARATVMGG